MRLLTVEEVALILRISQDRVYDLVRANALPHIHVGRFIRVSEDTLNTWLASGGTPSHETKEPPLPSLNGRATLPIGR